MGRPEFVIETSVVMTAYRRAKQLRQTLTSIFVQDTKKVEVIVVEDGFDGCETMDVCADFSASGCPIYYIRRNGRPKMEYSNQAVPMNIGIRKARGDVLILQNAECKHISAMTVEALTDPHRRGSKLAVFAACVRLGEETEPSNLCSPYFYCGSIRRDNMYLLGGFDEEFVGWGAEDCDLGNRMRHAGIRFEFRSDIVVHHQQHVMVDGERCGYAQNLARMEMKLAKMNTGIEGPEANVGQKWGTGD